jgi:Reverse transcriptase (RNA-dependent DNA polymerase)
VTVELPVALRSSPHKAFMSGATWVDHEHEEDISQLEVVMDSACNKNVASVELAPYLLQKVIHRTGLLGVSGLGAASGTGQVPGVPQQINSALVVDGAPETLWNMGGLVDALKMRFEGDSDRIRFYIEACNEPVLECKRRSTDKLWVCKLGELQRLSLRIRDFAYGARKAHTTEEKKRALEVLELHNATHPGDSTLVQMLTIGVYSHLGLGQQDVNNMRDIIGPCAACAEAKVNKTTGPPSDNPPARLPGEYFHVDIIPGYESLLLLFVCDCSTLPIVIRLLMGKSKKSLHDGYVKLLKFCHSYNREVKKMLSDSEECFHEAEDFLARRGITPKYTPPDSPERSGHEKKCERKVETIKKRTEAIRAGMSYQLNRKTHPTALQETDLFCAAAYSLYWEPNKATQGLAPYQFFTEEGNPLRKFPGGKILPFGTIVRVVEQHGTEFGCILWPDLTSQATYEVRFPNWKGKSVETLSRAAVCCHPEKLPPAAWGWELKQSLSEFVRAPGPLNRELNREVAIEASAITSAPAPVPVLGGELALAGSAEQEQALEQRASESTDSAEAAHKSADHTKKHVTFAPSVSLQTERAVVLQKEQAVDVQEAQVVDDLIQKEQAVRVEGLTGESSNKEVPIIISESVPEPTVTSLGGDTVQPQPESSGSRPRRAAAQGNWRNGPVKHRESLRAYFNVVFDKRSHQRQKKQMNYKAYIKMHPERGKQSVHVELDNWDRHKVAVAQDPAQLTPEDWKDMLRSLAFTIDKHHASGEYNKTKTRLCVNGNPQDKFSLGEIYSPTVETVSVFILLVLMALTGGRAFVYDVTGAFLHAPIEPGRKPIYVRLDSSLADEWIIRHPEAAKFRLKDGGLVLRLLKYAYGLREAPRKFHEMLMSVLIAAGYKTTLSDRCVVVKDLGDEGKIIATLHVDDELGLIIGEKLGDDLLSVLQAAFGNEVSCHPAEEYLGMVVEHDKEKGVVQVSQKAYWEKALAKYSLEEIPTYATPALDDLFKEPRDTTPVDVTTYQSLVMSAMFGARLSRPDILLALSYLATKCQNPVQSDLDKVIRVFGYIKGTLDLKLVLKPKGHDVALFTDASFGVHTDGKSHGGIIITIGGAPVLFKSAKIKSVKISSTGAETGVLCEGSTFLLWTRGLMNELGFPTIGSSKGYQDNNSAISQTTDECQFRRSKQDLIQMAFVRELVRDGDLSMVHLPTDEMMADILTKPLQGAKFRYLRAKLLGHIDIDGNSNI